MDVLFREGQLMGKVLSMLGGVVAALLLLVFALDLALGIPFSGASKVMDVGFIICALILAYLSWSTFREQA
jgi:hypothetical protein